MEHQLSLPEKLYLLSINPQKGGLVNSEGLSLDYSIIAAYIMELERAGNIEIVDSRIRVKSFNSGCVVNAFILKKFKKFDNPLKISRWFNRLYYSLNHIKRGLKAGLVEKRVIRLEGHRFLFFGWQKPFLLEKTMAREMSLKVGNMVYEGQAAGDWKMFLSLIEPAGLLKRIFGDRQKRRNARQRLKQMNVDNEITVALKKAIAGARAAAVS